MYLNEETQNISHDKVQNGTSLYNSFVIPLQINFAARGKKKYGFNVMLCQVKITNLEEFV